jgi:uncharacterized membrane protein YdjX (TVP38/TMEM64 family)
MVRFRRMWLVLAFLLVLWAGFRLSGLDSQFSAQFLHERFEAHKLEGLLLFTGLFALGNLVQIPGWIFLASAVAALGPFWGGMATYVAACVTCSSTFWIIRAVGADALREFKGRWSARLFAQLDAHPLRSVVALRLLFQTIPALNYALALSGVRFRHYLLGTLLGLPLPILLYTLFFGTLANWLHWSVPASP